MIGSTRQVGLRRRAVAGLRRLLLGRLLAVRTRPLLRGEAEDPSFPLGE